ncbi:hypothetical protein DBR32_00655 [Taibaiella sp. KBW10]|uniref:ChaN family lipoprotein n=1 Tax=Taibaiella sp. KBW10 TaxID=2153357 RepID=UPI000F5AE39F|nr:ChaN family lipoprotein [Taibaiella sp. KBW10]RQO32157.1 hypothetical protein DBR32_00655 [Taibaiella sp. KBW10]
MYKTTRLILLIIFGLFSKAFGQKSELIIIGNVHKPMAHYNADSLYAILEALKPDIILLEIDSSYFAGNRAFKHPGTENEQMATTQFLSHHPQVHIGPFEFEGRNEYRRAQGIKQSEAPAMHLLDSLFETKQLTKKQRQIITTYRKLSDSLNSFGFKSAYFFNNTQTDRIAERRQYYQHVKVRQVINQRTEFASRFVNTSAGVSISLAEGYNRFCDFWDLRNQTMAQNIIQVMDQNPNKKVIVLTGYYHRYYLLDQIKKRKQNRHFSLKEFYEK